MSVWYRAHTNSNPQFVFSGDGGLYTSGRWNHLGKRVVYCSDSIALATMEWLAHNGLSVSGFSYYRYSIEVPDHLITAFSISDLPTDWDATPSTNDTRDFANDNLFLKDGPLAIRVPSVLVPEEKNLIINPFHTEFQSVVTSITNLGKFIAPTR